MKKIRLIAVGGTISYQKGKGTLKNGEQLLREAGDCFPDIMLDVINPIRKASSAMQISDLFLIAKCIQQTIRAGIDGIVITQGTDTIEETAFFLTLIFRKSIPIIITGAMKHSGLPGSDGGANLSEAILAATDDRLANQGAVVLFQSEIYSGWFVRKVHTQKLNAFSSYFGPIGYFSERCLRIIMEVHHPTIPYDFAACLNSKPAEVYLASMSIGDDGRMIGLLKQNGYKGLVVEGLGGGHVSTGMAEQLIKLADVGMPVVIASRTDSGETLRGTYEGYPGSETELQKHGMIMSGLLDGRKARLLLILLITSGKSVSEVREVFSTMFI